MARAAPPSIRLRRTRIDGGLIGSFSFDANGDISESPVTILRPRTAGTAGTREGTEGAEGARVERVVRPTARLVGRAVAAPAPVGWLRAYRPPATSRPRAAA
jgi:hypothetical protein